MPLSQHQLQSALEQAFNNPAGSVGQKASAIAQAYSRYSQAAISPGGGTVDPSAQIAKQATLANSLEAVFKSAKNGPAVANGMGLAFSVFWALPPTVFIAVPPGLVSAAIPSTLVASIASSGNKNDTRRSAASKLAKNLHQWTTTAVIVTHLPVPPGPIGPIT